MEIIRQEIHVSFRYDVHFTENVFDPQNELLGRTIASDDDPEPHKVLVAVDDGLIEHYPRLVEAIGTYFAGRRAIEQVHPPVIIPGGETAKNDPQLVRRLHSLIYKTKLCRHSYVIALGGGSVIDLVGYAAATAHRGIRLIRIPTTVLSQNDSAVGVKNGVNAFDTKNFVGTFAPPAAVINDVAFLRSLDDRDWRSGISEAIKIALLKDASFLDDLESDADRLAPPGRDLETMRRLVFHCAKLHLEHIATSGDPFETGTSRPLDFGHWSAHQLEQLTNYQLRHGEAVAIGIALDTTYSYLMGMLDRTSWRRVLKLFEDLGFELYVPELDEHMVDAEHSRSIFQGLERFREHLGGELTIMLLEGIGRGVEVHDVDLSVYRRAISALREWHPAARNVA